MEAADGGHLGTVAFDEFRIGRGRARHFDRQDVAERRCLVGVGIMALSGDEQQAAAALADKVGQVFQVLVAQLSVLGINIAQDDHVELVQLDLAGEAGDGTLILRSVILIGIAEQDFQVDGFILGVQSAFPLQQGFDEAIFVAGITFDIEQFDQLGLANENRALQFIVVGLRFIRLGRDFQHVDFFSRLGGHMCQPEFYRLPLGIDTHELGVEDFVFSFFFERDVDGLVGVALTGETGFEDDTIVDINGVLHLQVVQIEIAQLVRVADADEIKGDAHLGGIAGNLGQAFAVRSDAVGEHDNGRQRRAAKIIQDLAYSGAELAAIPLGAQIADGGHGGVHLLDIVSVGQILKALGSAGTMINVNLDLTIVQKCFEPMGTALSHQGLGELQAFGSR